MPDGTPAAPAVSREKVKPGIWRRKNAKGQLVYEITYRDSDGRQRRQTVAGGVREAQTALADVKARMGRGQRVAPAPRLLFADAADAWFEEKSPALADKTIQAYRYALDVHLLPMFGRERLDRIDVSVVSKFVARMATASYRAEVESRLAANKPHSGRRAAPTEGYSVETIKLTLTPMSRTFAYAKRNLGFAGENPVMALDIDERPGYRQRKEPPRTLTRAELDRLIAHARSPWREIIATAAALGTRAGETLGLRWQDIDFAAGKVTIEQQANDRRKLAQVKTASSRRSIEAPDWLMAMFASLKLAAHENEPGDLVFATRTGKPHGRGNLLGRGLYPALDAAGLERTTFHALRHTHASLWIKDGGDVVTLSRRLGHTSPQITMTTYAHVIEEASDDAVRRARVDAMYAGSSMAAAMAASGGNNPQESASATGGEVVEIADARRAAQ